MTARKRGARHYPDATYEETVYNRLDPEKQRDRLGRWSHAIHDALRRVVAARDPAGRTTIQQWCTCGSLDKLIDASGNATSWDRDLQERMTKETRPDGSFWEYTYETTTSRLKKQKDAKGQEAQYAYFVDDRLQQVSYPTAQITTPSVSYTYESAHPRLATVVDGLGTTTYGYHPITATPVLGAARLATVDGPFSNDTATYAYDELSRLISRTLNSVTTTWSYDALGRFTNLGDPIGSFTAAYVGTTSRLSSLTYPNGQMTSYAYFPNSGDKHLQEIHHRVSAGGATLSKLNHGYDAVGNITLWTQQYGAAAANAYDLKYDPADQLWTATYRTTDQTPITLKRYGYAYDALGNRTTEQVDDAPTLSGYDTRNRLTTQQPGGALAFKGSLNEAATITVAAKPAAVGTDNKFQRTAQVGSGTSNVVVVATDPSGNVRTNTYQLNVSGSSRSFTYDANGSLTAEGTKTYEWDGANRLVRVLDNAAEIARFVYDGQGRRAQKIAGGVTRTYVHDHEDIIEERPSTGATIRYVHATGIDQPIASVEAGVASYFLADHLGSVLQTTNASATVTLTRQYDPWGNLTQGLATPGYAFTGREWDSETALYYYRARYYDPKIGRFISEDPLGSLLTGPSLLNMPGASSPAFDEDGDAGESFEMVGASYTPSVMPNAMSFGDGPNLYAYVRNDPVNLTDPLGLFACAAEPPPKTPPPPPGKKLKECLEACEKGKMAEFCRKIKNPRARAGCWAVVLVSKTACKGWCYYQYGK
jgi:RHS repeat-associated protein